MTSQTISRHIFIALSALFLAIYAEYTDLDLWIAHQFYDSVNQQWPLRSMFITKTLLHDDAQIVIKLLGIVSISLVVISRMSERLRTFRKPLTYLFLATFTGPLIVTILKSTTHMQTPWRIAEFGGDMPYIRLFDSVNETLPIGYAFPGGHSSAGFAFFSLYFLCYFYAPTYRYLGLIIPLTLGILFAVDQEIRGAHFFSHDVMSLFICWSSALFWALFYLQRPSSATSGKYVTT